MKKNAKEFLELAKGMGCGVVIGSFDCVKVFKEFQPGNGAQFEDAERACHVAVSWIQGARVLNVKTRQAALEDGIFRLTVSAHKGSVLNELVKALNERLLWLFPNKKGVEQLCVLREMFNKKGNG